MTDPHLPSVFVIAGPSGAGKGSVVSGLRQRVDNLWLSRSWTTRPRRQGESPDAYHFVDRDRFESRAAEGGFLEWNSVFDHLYGTPVPETPPGHDVLLEIDVQGARDVKERWPEAVVILIVPPSRAVQEARLRGRGDPEEVIARRLAKADAEEAKGRALADHIVVNEDLGRAVDQVLGILESHRRLRA
ncbi:MAG: guanylate kinase [Acidimicrobiales bacterium]